MHRDGTAHGGLNASTSNSNQEDSPQSCPQDHMVEVILQLRFPLPRCVKLISRISHHRNIDLRNKIMPPLSQAIFKYSRLCACCVLIKSPTTWTSMDGSSRYLISDWSSAPRLPPPRRLSYSWPFVLIYYFYYIHLQRNLVSPIGWDLDLSHRLQGVIVTVSESFISYLQGLGIVYPTATTPLCPLLTGRKLFSLNRYCAGLRYPSLSLDDRLKPGQWDTRRVV